MSDQSFDVAIIGGGLAGCAAAIHLANQGHRVVLFEAQSYPHHKVCGEFLSPECGLLLADLGVMPALQAIGPAPIDTVRIIAPNGTTWSNDLPGTGIGISRYALDHLLVEQARASGVNVRTSTTVSDVQGTLDNGFSLTFRNALGTQTMSAKTVIGAQGKRSRIDRQLERGFFQNQQPFIGLKSHFRGVLPAGHIHLYAFPGGYCGMSAIENGLINVCLLVRQDVFQSANQPSPARVDSFILWMKGQNQSLGDWLSAAEQVHESWLSISQIPFVTKPILVNDILMAGDSAGLIPPIAGDGMGMALQAARMASDTLDLFLTHQISALDVRQRYSKLWWRTFGTRLRLSRVLQAFMLRPNWLTPGLRVMNALPAVGRLLVAHTRDRQLAHL
jgi:flavin-dependent dehydrogenase